MIKFVEDKAFVGEPKSSLVMLESKVKAVNPTYAKVSEVDKRITVRCQYEFGPNEYTKERIRYIEKGVDVSIKGAEK